MVLQKVDLWYLKKVDLWYCKNVDLTSSKATVKWRVSTCSEIKIKLTITITIRNKNWVNNCNYNYNTNTGQVLNKDHRPVLYLDVSHAWTVKNYFLLLYNVESLFLCVCVCVCVIYYFKKGVMHWGHAKWRDCTFWGSSCIAWQSQAPSYL